MMSGAGARNIAVPQNKYSLLHVYRNQCIFENRYTIISAVLLVLTFLILSIFVATIGIYNQALYPKYTNKKEIPKQWIDRAVIYNSITNYTINATEEIIHTKITNINKYKLVCYYQFPSEQSVKNKYPRVLLPNRIDPNLCTHINLAFAGIVNHSLYLQDYYLNYAKTIIDMKKYNKDLKVLLSVGGAGAEGFSEMVEDHRHRKIFIQSIDYYVRHYKFDGIDLDWEFPNMNPSADSRQKMHFTQLLREIRNEINRQDKHTFLLSVAVAAPVFIVDIAYDVGYMNDYVDYINLMTYDLHFYTNITPFTGLNAPLYSPLNEVGYFSTLNINYTSHYWHSKGMEKHKIIIGLPTYGHSYKLLNTDNKGLYAPARGYGNLGTNGFIDYYDICWFLNKNQIQPFFVVESKSPYATKYTEWISYDDQNSLTFKAEFIKNNNFGGAMIFSLNTDDHEGYCKTDGNLMHFPLTNRVKTVLNDQQL